MQRDWFYFIMAAKSWIIYRYNAYRQQIKLYKFQNRMTGIGYTCICLRQEVLYEHILLLLWY